MLFEKYRNIEMMKDKGWYLVSRKIENCVGFFLYLSFFEGREKVNRGEIEFKNICKRKYLGKKYDKKVKGNIINSIEKN